MNILSQLAKTDEMLAGSLETLSRIVRMEAAMSSRPGQLDSLEKVATELDTAAATLREKAHVLTEIAAGRVP